MGNTDSRPPRRRPSPWPRASLARAAGGPAHRNRLRPGGQRAGRGRRARHLAAKGRPADNPLIVHVPAPEDAVPLCRISPAARALMERFCPGPLTLLMPKKPCVPDVVNAGLPSVAVRIPSHPVAQRVLHACGVPRGRAQRQHLRQAQPHHGPARLPRLKGKLPLILDGGESRWGWRAPWWT